MSKAKSSLIDNSADDIELTWGYDNDEDDDEHEYDINNNNQ